MLSALPVHGLIARPLGCESVDIAVVHAKRCGNQHSIVDFQVGRALRTRLRDVIRGYVLAALLDFPGDHQWSFQLFRDAGVLEIGLYPRDQLLVVIKARCGDCAVNRLAVIAVV